MSDYLVTDTELTAIANAIRTKGGTSASLSFPAEFVSAINAIETGGSGLEYEEGTFTPTEAVNTIYIPYANTHTTTPVMVFVIDATETKQNSYNSFLSVFKFSFVGVFGSKFYSTVNYTESAFWTYTGAYSTVAQQAQDSSAQFGSNTQLYLNNTTTSIYYRVGRTYKWIAIWK